MRLQEKVTVVTGAASGIGKAMALRFAREGARLVLGDINEDAVLGTAAEIEREGAQAVTVVGDLGDSAVVNDLVDRAWSEWGRLDILCNNAGILDALTPVADCSDELWEQVMSVNLTGPMMTCRRALPKMIEQGGGVLLNTTSVAASGGGRGGAAYTASKHGVLGLTRSIAWYYGDKGIRCNAISPGAIMTPMAIQKQPHSGGMEKMAPHIPIIQRYGEPDEVASAALFLVSDEATYLNGSVLTVDGGWTIF